MNNPIFVINGKERRKVKKELNSLKSFVKGFWYFHQLEKDMGTCMMTDEKAKELYDLKVREISELEYKMNIKL